MLVGEFKKKKEKFKYQETRKEPNVPQRCVSKDEGALF